MRVKLLSTSVCFYPLNLPSSSQVIANEQVQENIQNVNALMVSSKSDYLNKISEALKTHFGSFTTLAIDFSKIREEFVMTKTRVDASRSTCDDLQISIEKFRSERIEMRSKLDLLISSDEEKALKSEIYDLESAIEKAHAK